MDNQLFKKLTEYQNCDIIFNFSDVSVVLNLFFTILSNNIEKQN